MRRRGLLVNAVRALLRCTVERLEGLEQGTRAAAGLGGISALPSATHQLAELCASRLRIFVEQIFKRRVSFSEQAITPLFKAMQATHFRERRNAGGGKRGADGCMVLAFQHPPQMAQLSLQSPTTQFTSDIRRLAHRIREWQAFVQTLRALHQFLPQGLQGLMVTLQA